MRRPVVSFFIREIGVSGTNGNDNVALADFLYIIAACAADNIVHMIGRWVVASMSYGAISA